MKQLLDRLFCNDPYLKELFLRIFRYRLWLCIAVAGMIAASGASSLIAIVVGKITDVGFYDKNPSVLVFAPAALIGTALLHGTATFLSAYFLSKITQHIVFDVRHEMLERVLHWPSQEVLGHASGDVVSKFVNEAASSLTKIGPTLTVMVRDSLQVAALVGVLIWHDITLTAVTLLVMPPIALLIRLVSKRIKKLSSRSFQAVADMSGTITEMYDSEQVIKIYDGYAREQSRFGQLNRRLRDLAMKIQVMSGLGSPATQIIMMAGVSVVVVVAVLQVKSGVLTVGQFVTYLSAMLLLSSPVRSLAGIFGSMARLSAAATSVKTLLDVPLETDPGTAQLPKPTGAIRFDHVTIRYPGADRPAVKDFTLDVQPGQMVALVGASGAGKTSLVNAIPLFWIPESGQILFDGIPSTSVTLFSLRAAIALVSQDIHLFAGTIAENIAYGNLQATQQEIRQAAEDACLTDFIAAQPEGLGAPIGADGGLLSGGQRQRLSIARAFIKKAPILILDEATSALDSESERHIQQALARLTSRCTSFVVAHRLTTIERADVIVVMDQGRIAEVGRHSDLLARGGLYARLYQAQFAAAGQDTQPQAAPQGAAQ